MDHDERQPDGPQAGARAGPVELAVQRFIAAQRIHTLYPANNPNVRAAVAKLREAISAFPSGSPLQVDVKGEHLECDEAPVLTGHKEVRDLARKLYLGHVASILFEPDVTDAEIITLFDVLRLGEEERLELGPLEDALPRRGVARIQVRDAGRVKLEELTGGPSDPWDIASLEELEELEREVLGGGRRGFREALRAVADGEDAKASRLTGLLDKPVEFATLLLEVASRHRPNNQIDLDAQLAFTLKLVSEIEHMIEKLAVQDRARLYRKLQDVVDTLVRSIRREILDVALPPYVRLGAIARLFPATIRMLTVKEALGLGLGAGLMPFLMGALRRVAAGDRDLPAFLSGAEPPEPVDEAVLAAYRPPALASALPVPPRLQPVFFEPAPGGAPHPGEMALSRAILDANGAYDSIATILDLLGMETDVQAYGRLLDRLVSRFTVALSLKNLEIATQVLGALHREKMRRASSPDHVRPELVAPAERAIAACGGREPMQAYADMLAATPMGSPEYERATQLVLGLGGTALASLLDILAEEQVTSTRRKLLDLLAKVGRSHVDLILGCLEHPRWYVVRNAVWILGQFGPSLIPQLRKMAGHAEPRVRREVVRALGKYREAAAVAGLVELLKDPDESVLREAIHKLGAIDARPSVPALHALAHDPGLGSRSAETIVTIAKALAELGGEDSATLLESLSAQRDAKGWLRSPEVKKALGESAQAIRGRVRGAGA